MWVVLKSKSSVHATAAEDEMEVQCEGKSQTTGEATDQHRKQNKNRKIKRQKPHNKRRCETEVTEMEVK
jgi:flagella basal body P-ring formation protein FlgA